MSIPVQMGSNTSRWMVRCFDYGSLQDVSWIYGSEAAGASCAVQEDSTLTGTYDIPLSGHVGKKKSTQCILQKCYWPTLYQDMAEYHQTCEVCKKTSQHKVRHTPVIPLSVVEEQFSQIAMDIVSLVIQRQSH